MDTASGTHVVDIDIDVELDGFQQFLVVQEDGGERRLDLEHLPPLQAHFELPQSYPYDEAPFVRVQSSWAADEGHWLADLESSSLDIWDHDSALFGMIDSLAHCLKPNYEKPLRLVGGALLHKKSLYTTLRSHNATMTRTRFASSTWSCSICLSTVKGKKCFQLHHCRHVYCSACLSGFFSVLIHEGLVRRVCCPDPECSKARVEAEKAGANNTKGKQRARLPGDVGRDELELIVGADLLKRYDRLIEKQRIESNPQIVECPRCSAAVEPPDGLDDTPASVQAAGAAKLRTCEQCSMSFCVFCKRTWHGSQTPCRVSHAQELVDRYLSADADQRAFLELQYGANVIKKLVDQHLEDTANEAWKSANSMPCPDCHISVEKSYGCSHMCAFLLPSY